MNCKSVQSLLSAYLDEELSGREMLDIREHLGDCGECRSEVQCLRAVKSILAQTTIPEPSAGFEDRLVSHVLASVPTPAEKRASFFTLSAVAAVSMIVTLLVLTVARSFEPPAVEAHQSFPSDIMRQNQAFDARWDGTAPGALYFSSNGR